VVRRFTRTKLVQFGLGGLTAFMAGGASAYVLKRRGTVRPPACEAVAVPVSVTIRGGVAPPGRAWPATFTNGPLGANNILPTAPTGILLGVQTSGYNGTWSSIRQRITDYQTLIGRHYDFIHHHYDGSGSWDGVFGCEDLTLSSYNPLREQWTIDNNSYNVIAWSPNYTIGQMNTGSADAIWAKVANYLKTYAPNRFIVRAFPEHTLAGYKYDSVPWSGNGFTDYRGAPFVTAWRRMVGVFQAAGATNVGFMYCVDEGGEPAPLPGGVAQGTGRDATNSCYPDDAYVDWVSSDCYAYNFQSSARYSTPIPNDLWQMFNYTFDVAGLTTGPTTCIAGGSNCRTWSVYDIFATGRATRDTLVRSPPDLYLSPDLPTRKPFVVGETGCLNGGTGSATPTGGVTQDTAKSNWYPRILSTTPNITNMTNMVGLCFFDADVDDRDNFLVDSPISMTAIKNNFVTMGQNAYFTGK
jgi:hypothetical protein